jgi:hypothetical protein
MNAIAAHRDELEKLFADLSNDKLLSGITLVVLVDAYIMRLDTNCPDIRARVTSPSICDGDSFVCVLPDPGDSARLLDYSVYLHCAVDRPVSVAHWWFETRFPGTAL